MNKLDFFSMKVTNGHFAIILGVTQHKEYIEKE